METSHSEFVRLVPARDLPLAGRVFTIEARPDELAALATRFGLLSLDRLEADGVIRPEAGGRRLRLEARLRAEIVQACVVTLDPVASRMDVTFERLFGFDTGGECPEDGSGGDVFLDLSDELPVEPITDDHIDIGAAVAEHLSLELDPYPRKPGAVFPGCDPGWDDTELGMHGDGPFARLAGWRQRQSSKG
jgi:uncharacterized metal-binding protein YceD (DUF177 family)